MINPRAAQTNSLKLNYLVNLIVLKAMIIMTVRNQKRLFKFQDQSVVLIWEEKKNPFNKLIVIAINKFKNIRTERLHKYKSIKNKN